MENNDFRDLLKKSLLGFHPDMFIPRVGNYPLYNIKEIDNNGEKKLILELALAGINPEDVKVSLKNSFLTISYKKTSTEENNVDYIVRNISSKEFSVRYTISEGLEVDTVKFENGLLVISFYRKSDPEKVFKIDYKK